MKSTLGIKPTTFKLSTLFLAVAFSTATQAAEQSPIVVTATRTAQTVDESLATVTVISRQDIEASQAVTLSDVLKTKTGLHVTSQGSVGKSQSVFMRGTEAGHILVLIDGVRASSATTGEYAWENISAEQVERVEVVYGPRASLYGSDAIGGVINITTRATDKTAVSVAFSSYNTQQTNISTGGGKDWKYTFSAGQLTTGGFPSKVENTEDLGHKRQYFSATLKNQLSSATSLDASINHSQGSNEHSTSTGDSTFKNQVVSTSINNAINDSWNQKLMLGHTIDQRTSFSPSSPSTITTVRNSASWQHDFFIGDNTTTAGVDYWQDHANKNDSGIINKKINNSAIYLQQQWNGKNNDVIINARSDSHSEFGNKVTGSLAWGHNFGHNRLVFSYGTAFKAPSVNDLFWPYSTRVSSSGTTYITQGNLNVTPEISNTTEISWRSKPTKNLTWNTNIYQTEIDDMIDWQATLTAPKTYTYVPTNVDSVTIKGFETSVSYTINDWKLDANLNFLNAKNNKTYNQLDRRPDQSINTTITRRINNKQFAIETSSVSERNDRDGKDKLESCMLINFLFSHDVSDVFKWNFRLDNITKTEYYLAGSPSGNYNTPGRNARIGLNYTF